MPYASSARPSLVPWAWLAALGLSALLFASEVDRGFDLADEGFLWHGVERTARGEVPERDFQAAYEPGRYYWAALFQHALGPGLFSLRAATASFGAIGLALGLCAAARGLAGRASLLALALVLALWMGPRHKLFEPAVALAAALAFTRLLERPDSGRHAQAGAAVGLALCIGRNHALYCAAALAACLAWLWLRAGIRPRARALAACAAGGAAGALPLALLCAAAPGYAQAFASNVVFYAVHGANQPLPVPWPWRSSGAAVGPGISLGFALEALLPLALCVSLWRRRDVTPARAAALASASVALAYSHHAFARADAAHLAQALPPLLVAAASWPRATGRRALEPALLGALVGLCLLALPELRPSLAERLAPRPEPLAALDVRGQRLWLPRAQARELEALERALASQLPADARLFAAPALPGIHPWLERVAASRRSYFLWPATAAEEERLLDELARPGPLFALLQQGAPFGSDALRFERTHPRVYRELVQSFARVAHAEMPEGYLLLARAAPGAADLDAEAALAPSF